MKEKPLVRKISGSWCVIHPGYGFASPWTTVHNSWISAVTATLKDHAGSSTAMDLAAPYVDEQVMTISKAWIS